MVDFRHADNPVPFSKMTTQQPQQKETAAEQVQWRNIRNVVKQLADFCFESKDHPKYGSSWLAITHALTAKDGIQPMLEPLPKLFDSAPTQDVSLPLAINDEELSALRRFDECVSDGEGYDVKKDMMKRLAVIGLVRRVSADIYEHTEFGCYVLQVKGE